MKVEVKLEGLDGVLKTLQSLPPEMVSRRGGVVLRALKKGANLIRNQARANFKRNVSSPGKTGVNWGTGFTERYIITRRAKMFQGGPKGERVVVTVKSLPHQNKHKVRNGRPFRTNDAAFIMEYGSAKQPAEPWIRPAFESRKLEATQAVETELLRQIDLVVKKLAARNRNR